jgi:predicted transposase YdaD
MNLISEPRGGGGVSSYPFLPVRKRDTAMAAYGNRYRFASEEVIVSLKNYIDKLSE